MTEQRRWHWVLCAQRKFNKAVLAKLNTRHRRSVNVKVLKSADYGKTVREVVKQELESSWWSSYKLYTDKRIKARWLFYFTHAYGKTPQEIEDGDKWRQELWFVPMQWWPKDHRKFYIKELIAGRMTRLHWHVKIQPRVSIKPCGMIQPPVAMDEADSQDYADAVSKVYHEYTLKRSSVAKQVKYCSTHRIVEKQQLKLRGAGLERRHSLIVEWCWEA